MEWLQLTLGLMQASQEHAVGQKLGVMGWKGLYDAI